MKCSARPRSHTGRTCNLLVIYVTGATSSYSTAERVRGVPTPVTKELGSKGCSTCFQVTQLVGKVSAPCPSPSPCARGHLLRRLPRSCPSSHGLPGEVCKKVISAPKLACRSWRLNKQTRDRLLHKVRTQPARAPVSLAIAAARLRGCLTMAVPAPCLYNECVM